MASIQGIYLAFFGRPADPEGLAFWEEQTQGGADLSVMLDALAFTAEYQARFEGMSDAQIITSIYQSLFNRDPEPEGLAFFLEALANGTLTLTSIAVGILDGAQGDDLITVQNKEAAANLFTASLDTPEKIAAYVGEDAAQIGRDFISKVTSDPQTIPSQGETQNAVNELPGLTPDEGQVPDEGPGPGGGGGGGGGPQPTTATATIETVANGFDSGDLSTWVIDRYEPHSFAVEDGTLIHKISDEDGATGRPSGFSGAFYNTQGMKLTLPEGVQRVSVDLKIDASWENAENRHAGLWGTAKDEFGNIAAYPIVEFRNDELPSGGDPQTRFTGWDSTGPDGQWDNGELLPDFAYGKVYTLSYSRNADGSFQYEVTDTENPDNTVSFVSLNSYDAIQIADVILQGYNTVEGRTYTIEWDNLIHERATIDGDYTGFDILASNYGVLTVFASATITGDQASGFIFVGEGTLTVVNAHDLDLSRSTVDLDVTGTSGNDTITGGLGDDTIYSSAGSDTITFGAGDDVYILSALSHSGSASPDVITDFNAGGNDRINLSEVGVASWWGFVGSFGDLEGALDAVEIGIEENEAAYFQLGGNTYVVATNDSHLGGDFALIKLTGLVTLEDTDFIFA